MFSNTFFFFEFSAYVLYNFLKLLFRGRSNEDIAECYQKMFLFKF